MRILLRSILVGATLLLLCAQRSPAKIVLPLTIYCIDVEGGQATLFVTPDGESLLVDTGWDGNNGRDATSGKIPYWHIHRSRRAKRNRQ